jgi:hypothetical protein
MPRPGRSEGDVFDRDSFGNVLYDTLSADPRIRQLAYAETKQTLIDALAAEADPEPVSVGVLVSGDDTPRRYTVDKRGATIHFTGQDGAEDFEVRPGAEARSPTWLRFFPSILTSRGLRSAAPDLRAAYPQAVRGDSLPYNMRVQSLYANFGVRLPHYWVRLNEAAVAAARDRQLRNRLTEAATIVNRAQRNFGDAPMGAEDLEETFGRRFQPVDLPRLEFHLGTDTELHGVRGILHHAGPRHSYLTVMVDEWQASYYDEDGRLATLHAYPGPYSYLPTPEAPLAAAGGARSAASAFADLPKGDWLAVGDLRQALRLASRLGPTDMINVEVAAGAVRPEPARPPASQTKGLSARFGTWAGTWLGWRSAAAERATAESRRVEQWRDLQHHPGDSVHLSFWINPRQGIQMYGENVNHTAPRFRQGIARDAIESVADMFSPGGLAFIRKELARMAED